MRLAAAVVLVGGAAAVRRPPVLGYNSYDQVGCCADEHLVRTTAAAMLKYGFKSAGYTYIGVDCGWAAKERDNATGSVMWDAEKFPSGIPALASDLHAMGFKLGVYSDRGPSMFFGGPGMQGHEAQDAMTFAQWGVDLLKVDDMSSKDHTVAGATKNYDDIRDGLAAARNATGHRVHYVTCGHTGAEGYPPEWERSWMGEVCAGTADQCRIAEDTRFWGGGKFGASKSVNIVAELNKRGLNGVDGAWADPDLVFSYTAPEVPSVGACGGGFADNRTWAYQTQFALWAVMPAPIAISTDLRNATNDQLAVFLNPEVIAVHQDSLAVPGQRVAGGNLTQIGPGSSVDVDGVTATNVWARELADGSRAVIFINNGDSEADVECDRACFSSMGLAGKNVRVRDLWARKDVGSVSAKDSEYAVKLGGAGKSALFRFTVL
eukprot:TRINITY_DN24825_c0_g1_i1.p1 TRINITY_DN24825_c0_g1~~TRINITY_DN24825_c0_g1_i1.p1  ORF type:complete len:434 (+),score=66.52 TRINITY_DN24825_c0_g1_i1:69-1370(+)